VDNAPNGTDRAIGAGQPFRGGLWVAV
jgi:hypothetical protein